MLAVARVHGVAVQIELGRLDVPDESAARQRQSDQPVG